MPLTEQQVAALLALANLGTNEYHTNQEIYVTEPLATALQGQANTTCKSSTTGHLMTDHLVPMGFAQRNPDGKGWRITPAGQVLANQFIANPAVNGIGAGGYIPAAPIDDAAPADDNDGDQSCQLMYSSVEQLAASLGQDFKHLVAQRYRALRREAHNRANGKCPICGNKVHELHSIHKFENDRPDIISNLYRKGAHTYEELKVQFIAYHQNNAIIAFGCTDCNDREEHNHFIDDAIFIQMP